MTTAPQSSFMGARVCSRRTVVDAHYGDLPRDFANKTFCAGSLLLVGAVELSVPLASGLRSSRGGTLSAHERQPSGRPARSHALAVLCTTHLAAAAPQHIKRFRHFSSRTAHQTRGKSNPRCHVCGAEAAANNATSGPPLFPEQVNPAANSNALETTGPEIAPSARRRLPLSFLTRPAGAKGSGNVCQPEQLVSPPRPLTEVSGNEIVFFPPRRAIRVRDPCVGRIWRSHVRLGRTGRKHR